MKCVLILEWHRCIPKAKPKVSDLATVYNVNGRIDDLKFRADETIKAINKAREFYKVND